MFRTKPFLFNAPLHKEQKKSLKKDYDHKIQVLVCGSHAREVMLALGKFESVAANENNTYAFCYRTHGHAEINVKLDYSTRVEYKETRDKKKREADFKHDDNIEKQSESSNLSANSLELCAPDFQSNMETILLIAGENKDETNGYIDDLSVKLKNANVLRCNLLTFPENSEAGSSSWSTGGLHYNPWSITHLMLERKGFAKSLADSLIESCKKAADAYINNLEKQVVDEVKKEILGEFEQTIHQQADEYFEKHKGPCSIM